MSGKKRKPDDVKSRFLTDGVLKRVLGLRQPALDGHPQLGKEDFIRSRHIEMKPASQQDKAFVEYMAMRATQKLMWEVLRDLTSCRHTADLQAAVKAKAAESAERTSKSTRRGAMVDMDLPDVTPANFQIYKKSLLSMEVYAKTMKLHTPEPEPSASRKRKSCSRLESPSPKLEAQAIASTPTTPTTTTAASATTAATAIKIETQATNNTDTNNTDTNTAAGGSLNAPATITTTATHSTSGSPSTPAAPTTNTTSTSPTSPPATATSGSTSSSNAVPDSSPPAAVTPTSAPGPSAADTVDAPPMPKPKYPACYVHDPTLDTLRVATVVRAPEDVSMQHIKGNGGVTGGYYLQEDNAASGRLHFPPGASKLREIALAPEIFFVNDCEEKTVEFEMYLNQSHQTNYLLSAGDCFSVPPGNSYSIKNLSKDKAASLCFVVVTCEVRWHPDWHERLPAHLRR